MSVVQNLFRDYGSFRIDIPHWEIPDEGITALWGPSGAGKTTVFRLLLGLEPCPGLKWIFKTVDLAQLPVPKRKLGVVFQSYHLFPHMTARENIEFAQEARKISFEERKKDLDRLQHSLHLLACWERPAHLLSGGEQQRVALARALAGRPQFLFLDEPFSALDRDLRIEARSWVKNVIDEFQVPTLLVTHDVEDLNALQAKKVRMEEGLLKE